jgi:hypothetical protein
MKRRDFLKRVAPMSLLPFAINGQPVRAYGKLLGSEAEAFTQTDKILVLVRLNGGNDGFKFEFMENPCSWDTARCC